MHGRNWKLGKTGFKFAPVSVCILQVNAELGWTGLKVRDTNKKRSVCEPEVMDMIGEVSTVAITGIIFSAVIAIGLPVVLLILVKVKLHTGIADAGIGALTFVLFALVLEQILHGIMLKLLGETLTKNIWLFAVYGGLAAGVFEETGRFVAMKFWMKKSLSKESSVMYGVGHGGIEAILIVGFTCISNLVTALMINSGQIESAFSTIEDGAGRETALQGLSVLWTTPGYQFFLAGVERISAVTLHICLSYLVYRAIKYGMKKYYFLAVGIHFLVDALTVLLSNYTPLVILEAVLLIMIGVLAVMVGRMYMEEERV